MCTSKIYESFVYNATSCTPVLLVNVTSMVQPWEGDVKEVVYHENCLVQFIEQLPSPVTIIDIGAAQGSCLEALVLKILESLYI